MFTTIGWWIGKDDWAFKNMVEHLVASEKLAEYTHLVNQKGDVNVVMTPTQLDVLSELPNKVFHLNGNRWRSL